MMSKLPHVVAKPEPGVALVVVVVQPAEGVVHHLVIKATEFAKVVLLLDAGALGWVDES